MARPQLVGVGDQVVERLVAQQERRRRLGADADGARHPVGRVAAQRDEVDDLLGQHPVALHDRRRVDPGRRLTAGLRGEHGHGVRDELVCVAVGGREQRRAAVHLLGHRGGREQVVGLVPRDLHRREAERLDHRRQPGQLIDDRGVERTARLVGGPQLAAVGRRSRGVPADEHGARPLGAPQAHEQVGHPDEGVDGPAPGPLDRRDRVVGAVGVRVAVDDQQRAAAHAMTRASSAFWACSRFSASSQAAECGPCSTSSVISSPTWAGRQCSTMWSGEAAVSSSAFTW